jgi:hypothetical protein
VRMQVRLGRIELESNMLSSFVMFVSLYSNVTFDNTECLCKLERHSSPSHASSSKSTQTSLNPPH